MPFRFEFDDPENTDRVLLHEFIRQLRVLLINLIYETGYTAPGLGFIAGTREQLEILWRETEPEFDRVNIAIDRVETRNLESVGLAKSALRAKLNILQLFAQRFRNAADAARNADVGGIGLIRRMVRLLSQLLGVINTILGSLAKALGKGEAIKELKDMLEHAIETEEVIDD
ncbi:MAG TPA: hypothetical protein VGG27_12740 [Magnetospirillaceae bacterium]|jgi:hypothetical protein